jgi:hypothetical protein
MAGGDEFISMDNSGMCIGNGEPFVAAYAVQAKAPIGSEIYW